ncbi:hypothetical protein C8A01DRAFT_21499, partial [Parachaetomium inaequale]
VTGDSEESYIYCETLEKIGYILVKEYNLEANRDNSENKKEGTTYYISSTKYSPGISANPGEPSTEVYFDIGSNTNLADKV